MIATTLRNMVLEARTKKQVDAVVDWVGTDQQRFDELVHQFLTGGYRLTQRAGWPLSYIAMAQPLLIAKHLKKMIDNLRQPHLHNAVKRNTVRILQQMDVPEELQGELMETCFKFIQAVDEPAAVKAFSLTILHNLSKKYPEILPEIKAIIADRPDHQTAAFKSRAKLFL